MGSRLDWIIMERLAASATVALLLLPGCGAQPEAGVPSVLLVTIDTLRADHLGAYGFTSDTSPHVDALAAQSVLFERADRREQPHGSRARVDHDVALGTRALDPSPVRGLKDIGCQLCAPATPGETAAAVVRPVRLIALHRAARRHIDVRRPRWPSRTSPLRAARRFPDRAHRRTPFFGACIKHLARSRPPSSMIREDHVLRGRVVPVVARCRLVVPDETACLGAHGEDRSEVEVVAAARAALRAIVDGAVAGADVEEIELRVVRHRIPHGAAEACLEERILRPRRRGRRQLRVLVRAGPALAGTV